mmetsp:Transcript_160259/g.514211  ORF Transcript_160259/g.514211 Transcript_160259/m.514211 type:complete len:216 (-) Transcript_160259:814-1461(-)
MLLLCRDALAPIGITGPTAAFDGGRDGARRGWHNLRCHKGPVKVFDLRLGRGRADTAEIRPVRRLVLAAQSGCLTGSIRRAAAARLPARAKLRPPPRRDLRTATQWRRHGAASGAGSGACSVGTVRGQAASQGPAAEGRGGRGHRAAARGLAAQELQDHVLPQAQLARKLLCLFQRLGPRLGRPQALRLQRRELCALAVELLAGGGPLALGLLLA